MKKKLSIFLLYMTIIMVVASTMGLIYKVVKYNPYKVGDMKIYSKTDENGFHVLKEGKWEKFFVKGVNIGVALPGKWVTEPPLEEETYLNWFKKIEEMNANSIRVYTLLPPAFYAALDQFNKENSDNILWLLQEIWPEENPEGHDYLKQPYIEDYFKEIEYVIDAIHGNALIHERRGRAYGIYKTDVSQYVLGYLVGRELEPDEVITTDNNNKGFNFKGEYLTCEDNASPTEAWLAMNCNYVLEYEEEKYWSQHPVAIVSWPTLDVKEHDSEWNVYGLKSHEYNDKASVDINHISYGEKMKAGLFGSYHIYPNYPDFINNEAHYKNEDVDHWTQFQGYLHEFIQEHKKYPALVAEFGLATGMGIAHMSPDGLHHGGLTEEEQGHGIVRMMDAIREEGYAGGVIFEWMDEWAKKTWTTEPYMIPYDRHAYWRNAIDPEQNYGILAMETEAPQNDGYRIEGSGEIKSITLKHDAAFLYMDINLDQPVDFNREKLLIGIDTYARDKGEFKFNEDIDIHAPSGLEFLVDIHDKDSKILVHPGYNIANQRHSSYASAEGIFEEIILPINNERITKDGQKIDAIYFNGSKLHNGVFEDNTYNHWYFEDNKIFIRLPWGRLGFSDPSSLTVLDDSSNIEELTRDKLATTKTEGILLSAILLEKKNNKIRDILNTLKPYTWEEWDENPIYKERLKKSYYIIQEHFQKID